jgi:hypothetical protein
MAVFVTHAMEEGWKQQSFARFCYPSFTVSLHRESRATKVIHCITVPSLFGEFYEIFRMKTH